jgi:hypothetical protein
MSKSYADFLAAKAQLGGDHGFEPTWLPSGLFDFQEFLIGWALRKGRAALFTDCGTGKSVMQLVWAENVARHADKPVLILTPLAVAQQTIREAEKFGIGAARSHAGEMPAERIVVTNYERLHHFDPTEFAGVVCDECFPAGTEVDTPTGRKHIENVTIGDKIVNAAGVDTVSDVHRREVPYAIRITVNGQRIVSSPNHPYFTRKGWRGALDLIPGDEILATTAAVRMVRGNIHGAQRASRENTILRSILLSEMAHEPTRAQGEGSHAGSRKEAGREAPSLVSIGATRSAGGTGAHSDAKSDQRSGGQGENLPHIESHEAQTFRAWGQRAWFDEAAADHAGCTRTDLGGGICFVTGPTDSGLSHSLQARLGRSRAENQYRSGWSLPPQPERRGRQARRETGFARVDRLEVLEPGHPDLERLRDADGKLYFYDLGGTRHPSFSVSGLLVHNSSILKNFDGSRRAEVTEFMRRLPYRLLATATAAPNDYHELGTSSEALGELGYMDVLGRFFITVKGSNHNSRGKYRIAECNGWRFRGHAEEPFWRWVSSWARAMRRPSDLGFRDDGFELPPLTAHEHVVTARQARPGMLFDVPANGFHEEREERRRTVQERCERAAALVNDTGQSAVVWCHLNDEGDLLERLIPDAVQVSGRDSDEAKEAKFVAFGSGQTRVLVTKPKIGAWGLNWQHCAHIVTFPSHSYEQLYQAVRRCWRFGQEREVVVDTVLTEGEMAIQANVQRKAEQADRMFSALTAHMRDALALERAVRYEQVVEVPRWAA